MKRTELPNEPPTRRTCSLRDSLLIATTAAALLLPLALRLPGRTIALTSTRANTPDDACAATPDIATFIIACGSGETDAVAEMQLLLKSIMLLTSVPLRFVFMTDAEGAPRIQAMFTSLGRTQRKVVVVIVELTEARIERWANETGLDPKAHHSGYFGTAKLAAPWLLPGEISVGVVLDTDMVLLKDPALLWQEALREEGDGFERGWVYRMILSEDMEKASQMCSCVVLARLSRARGERVYPDMVRKVFEANAKWRRQGSFKPPHGDQGVYNGLWKLERRLVGDLDGVWNRDFCHGYRGVFRGGDGKSVGILHRNCYHTRAEGVADGSEPFFGFYQAYRWHWLRAPEGHGCDVEVQK